jgi:hypothetical protein
MIDGSTKLRLDGAFSAPNDHEHKARHELNLIIKVNGWTLAQRSARYVLGTVLHEAAHALVFIRYGRGNRSHGPIFCHLAAEVGLDMSSGRPRTAGRLRPETKDAYALVLIELAAALKPLSAAVSQAPDGKRERKLWAARNGYPLAFVAQAGREMVSQKDARQGRADRAFG